MRRPKWTAKQVKLALGGLALVGMLPMTGEELRFELNDLDDFQVLP